MIQSLGKKTPFLGKYKEVWITFDTETLGVEVDGLLPMGQWENIFVEFDVNEPEDYAQGIYDTLKNLYPTLPLLMSPQRLVSTEGWHIDDTE